MDYILNRPFDLSAISLFIGVLKLNKKSQNFN